MPQIPVVESEVIIRAASHAWNGRFGIVQTIDQASEIPNGPPEMYMVELHQLRKIAPTGSGNQKLQLFRATELQVIDSSGSPGSVRKGHMAVDTPPTLAETIAVLTAQMEELQIEHGNLEIEREELQNAEGNHEQAISELDDQIEAMETVIQDLENEIEELEEQL